MGTILCSLNMQKQSDSMFKSGDYVIGSVNYQDLFLVLSQCFLPTTVTPIPPSDSISQYSHTGSSSGFSEYKSLRSGFSWTIPLSTIPISRKLLHVAADLKHNIHWILGFQKILKSAVCTDI